MTQRSRTRPQKSESELVYSSREELEAALAAAPLDPEPITDEEREALDIAATRTSRDDLIPWEVVRARMLARE